MITRFHGGISVRRASSSWVQKHSKDPYVQRAMRDGYRARSAYKLLEMNESLKLLNPYIKVMECGGAPGGWSQVLSQKVPFGLIISCDLIDYEPVAGVNILPHSDFTAHNTQSQILKLLKGSHLDLVLSDMSPNTAGLPELDHRKIIDLSYQALRFALNHSADGAGFLTKIFHGRSTETFLQDLRKFYKKVKVIKPKASRSESSEIYIYASIFKGLQT